MASAAHAADELANELASGTNAPIPLAVAVAVAEAGGPVDDEHADSTPDERAMATSVTTSRMARQGLLRPGCPPAPTITSGRRAALG